MTTNLKTKKMEILKTIEYKGCSIRIYQDSHPENPLECMDGQGEIRSFNSRHRNNVRSQEEADSLMEANPHHVKLSYFEHGNCVWSVMGEKALGTEGDWRWDGVDFAGLWLPDKDCLENIKAQVDAELLSIPTPENAADRAQLFRAKAREYARGVCEMYTQWCNGDVYGYDIVDANGDDVEGGCWGFYGWDNEKSGLLEQAQNDIDCHLQQKLRDRIAQVKTWIKNRVPLTHRQQLSV